MFNKIKNWLAADFSTTQVDFSLLFLRVFFSLFMLTHGYGKLNEWLAGNHDFPDPLHIGAYFSQTGTVFAEFFCSILLILGLGTRFAAAVLLFTMSVIAFIMHGNDPWGDKEHALLYFAVYGVIMILGAGRFSLDKMLFKRA
jgi:putative oxidoreductase